MRPLPPLTVRMGITTRRTKNHHTWRRGQDFFQGEKDRISFRERRTGFLSGRDRIPLRERQDSFRKSRLICFLIICGCRLCVSLYLNFMVVLLLNCMSVTL